MPRKVQDIVPGEHRSIREVPVSRESLRGKKTRGKVPEPEMEIETPVSVRRMPVTPPAPERTRASSQGRLKRLLVALGIVVVVGLVGFVASSFYSRANFTIIPKVIPISVNGTYVAQAVPATGAISYVVVTVKNTASSTVPATDGPKISTKSVGKVTLFNNYSSQSIRLIAGTKIVSDDGLLYRLSGSVVIPAYSKSSSTIVPGKVNAEIVADQAGQEYDLSKSDGMILRIFAYRNTPKYDSVYAKPFTDISGGFVGVKKIANPAAVASTTAQLKKDLTDSLLAKVKGSVPEGYIMYDGSYMTYFSSPVLGGSGRSLANLSIQGTVHGILFKRSELLSKFSNNQSATAFGKFGFKSPGLEDLQVSITNLKDFSPDKKGSLVVRAKGEIKLVGSIPVEDIKLKLQGMPLSSTQNIFRSYGPVIETGSGELVPPWAKIPSNSNRIFITVKEP